MCKLLSLSLLVIFAGCASSFFLKLQQDSLDKLQYPKKSFFETVLTHESQEVPDDLKNLSYPNDHLIQSFIAKTLSALSRIVVPLISSVAGVSGLSGGGAVAGHDSDDFDDDFDSDDFGSEVTAGNIGTSFDNDESVFFVASDKPKSEPTLTTTTTSAPAAEAEGDVDVRFSSMVKADPQKDDTLASTPAPQEPVTEQPTESASASPTTVTAQASSVTPEVIESPTTIRSSTTTEFEELTFDDLLNSTDDNLQSDSLVTTTSEKDDFADFSNEIN